ncbi:MAG: hypothetical protein Fur0039_07630 [Rhodocyclaceae bacterium]
MKKTPIASALLAAFAAVPAAQAATVDFDVITTWYEPDTRPKDSIFTGSFAYDTVTKQVTNLAGGLTESMTGAWPAPGSAPYYDMTILNLAHQMNDWVGSYSGPTNAPPSTNWHDDTLGGTFATVFLKNTTNTYTTMLGGDGWSPQSGANAGGIYHGWPGPYGSSIQNAYALIFVPDGVASLAPGASLTLNWNEAAQSGDIGLAYTSYADCAPGGMMGAVCMSSWSVKSYGTVGTMSGYPLTQTITAAVPEPGSYAMFMAGLGLMGFMARRRRKA